MAIVPVGRPAGRLRYFVNHWREITSDAVILRWIEGYKINFESYPIQPCPPRESSWSSKERSLISQMVKELIEKGAIRECQKVEGQFISTIFLVPKPDGSHRFILNLKKLDEFVKFEHFKLEDHKTAKGLINSRCFMAKIDLRDAYYIIPMAETDKKFLRFLFNDKLFEFNCLLFGLTSAPYVFTKIMRPVVAFLRSSGYLSVIYLDDILLFGKSYEHCLDNVNKTCSLLRELGFIINEVKSQMVPSRLCTFLGYVFDSEKMVIEVPKEKKANVKTQIDKFSTVDRCKIREFAAFIGTIGFCCQAVEYGWVHVKEFERQKYLALTKNNDNYDAFMNIGTVLQSDFEWWKLNIQSAKMSLRNKRFTLVMSSDASRSGWGACCNNERANGHWKAEEQDFHINYLELLAAFFGLKCFAGEARNSDILLRIDNTTAISYINGMGGVRFANLSRLAKEIWSWCEARNLWIFASYISSKENFAADTESRRLESETEFELSEWAFIKIKKTFGSPEIDLFATRKNTKCNSYVAWQRDPEAMAIDAFTLDWSPYFFTHSRLLR